MGRPSRPACLCAPLAVPAAWGKEPIWGPQLETPGHGWQSQGSGSSGGQRKWAQLGVGRRHAQLLQSLLGRVLQAELAEPHLETEESPHCTITCSLASPPTGRCPLRGLGPACFFVCIPSAQQEA